jgi:hypothetical protein
MTTLKERVLMMGTCSEVKVKQSRRTIKDEEHEF